VAAPDPRLREPRQAELGKPRADAVATKGGRHGEAIEKAGATVVTAQHRAHDLAGGRRGDRAEAGVALQEPRDSFLGIGFADGEAFDPGPELQRAPDVVRAERADFYFHRMRS